MIWRSDLSFEPAAALIDDEILRAAASHPARPAITDAGSGRTLTFGQLADGVRRLAAGLAERGIGRGDVVTIVAANSPDYAVALYGALAAGATVGSANPALTASELAHHFGMSRPRLVLSDDRSMAAVGAALAGRDAAIQPVDALGELLAAPRRQPAGRDPRDLALVCPSSGTTGLPKLAAHTHAGATAFFQGFHSTPTGRLTPSDTVGVLIPFSHLFGMAVTTLALRSGASVVTLPAFELEAFLRMLQDHAVTVAPVTPPLLAALARHPLVDRVDLRSLRLLICSAAPCAATLQEAAEARLGCVVGDYLGTTEAWCVAPAADPIVRGSVGRLAPNLEAVIVHPETGERLGPGEAGELWLRGPQVMVGYLGVPDAGPDGDGWLRTGDLCRFDADGNLYIVDRLKELIKVGGYSVAPAEVERELAAHPAVVDAAVVGRPHGTLGEIPVAYVALREPVAGEDLQAWLSSRLAPWKQVREVVVIEQVPRTPAGKLLRRRLAGQPTIRASSPRRDTPSFANAVDR